MAGPFVHLHVHSEYSMLDSLSRIGDLFDAAAERGQTALAITDHGTLGAMWQARWHADRTGVKLVPGIEAYLAIGSRFDREAIFVPKDDAASEGGDDGAASRASETKRRVYEHLTILARNRQGWLNLIALQNESSKHMAGRAKLIDYELLAEHAEGLMVLTGCVGGPVFGPLARAAAANDSAQELIAQGLVGEAQDLLSTAQMEQGRASDNLMRLIAAVGRENVYVEVMDHGNEPERRALPLLLALAAEHGLPMVATNDSHHTEAADRVAHGAWLAVQTKSTLANPKFSFHGSGYHLRSAEEMESLVTGDWWVTACRNSQLIADRVEAGIIPDPARRLPEFPVPAHHQDLGSYFKELVQAGIDKKLGGTLTEEYRQRLNFELHTIVSMGFMSYFLIVWEMITWARSRGILVGPGRGSAAGSLVAYLLDITDVDPIEYHLLFERFLEPGRAELPDIDVDFESRYKQDVIAHLMELWGSDCVAQIGNVGKPKVRAAWKNALRVLGEKPSLADKLGKLIPQDMTVFEVLENRNDPRLLEFWKAASALPYLEQAISLWQAFFEVASTSGVHASGVIISPEPLTELIPMRWAKPADATFHRWVTEWDYRDLEKFGLVKFDVLAIRNLDMAHVTMDLVQRHGVTLTLDTIPHPDHDRGDPRVQRAFEMLKAGRTAGVFQLESAPMTRLLEDVAPETLDELSAVVALFRPGPLSAGMHTKYADRKHGREAITYDYLTPDPTEAGWLHSVMGVTYGLFVYQEQLMSLGRVIAGFDDVWRSKLRKAVSKKDAQLMAEVGAKFLEGAVLEFTDSDGQVYSPVFAESTAVRVWEAMKGSASYLFNASHSLAYALIAYYTAYLKANFPGDYGAATLSVTDSSKPEKRIAAMNALIGEGIRILPPDVNISQPHTAPEGETDVRLGLGEIKGFGAVADDLVAIRTQHGAFTSLDHLLTTVKTGAEERSLATNQVEALIDSGALDSFGTRMGMHIIAKAGDLSELPIPEVEFSAVELGVRQSSRLLMMLDPEVRDTIQHTLSGWQRPGGSSAFEAPSAVPVGQLEAAGYDDGSMVYVSGILTGYHESPYSKGVKGEIELQDTSGSLGGIIWEEQRVRAKEAGDIPSPGFPVVLYGKLETRRFTVHSSQADEDGEDESEIVRRQIVVRGIYPIPITLAPTGFLAASTLPRVVLCDTPETEPAPAADPVEELDVSEDSAEVEEEWVDEGPAAVLSYEPLVEIDTAEDLVVAQAVFTPAVPADDLFAGLRFG